MLETLRAKPHHIKQSISIVVTAILFSVILFVWISSKDARSHELEVQATTVSPLDGVTSMFDGFMEGFKKKVANPSSFGAKEETATSTLGFDLSGVVVIDPTAATTTVATTTASSTKK